MDYKEKYENALEIVSKCPTDKYGCIIGVKPSDLFQELAESEDEKIRKGLLSHLRELREYKGTNPPIKLPEHYSAWIAWLEKQGEQNLDNSAKTCKDEQKPIPKFKVGDTMRTLQEATDGYTDGMPVIIFIDDKYYHCNNELIAIKDQDEYEYPPMNRRQKPAWSEDDEKIKESLINSLARISANTRTDSTSVNYTFQKEIEWLKDLKERYTWKPSEEQIEAIRIAAEVGTANNSWAMGVLNSLYQDLKKIREE